MAYPSATSRAQDSERTPAKDRCSTAGPHNQHKQGVFAQGFADDGVIVIVGKVLYILSDIMQRMLRGVEKWCTDTHLSVNPSKTETILFTRKYKPETIRSIYFYGKELELCTQVKYLGVILDPELSWKLHVEAKCNKALISFIS